MRWLFRWAFRLFLVAMVLGLGLLLAKDRLAQELCEHFAREATGLEVRVGRARLALFHPTLTLEAVRVSNPAEFGGSAIFEFGEIHAEYDRSALAWWTLHCRLLRVQLETLTLIRNPAGATNLDVLLARWQHRAAAMEPWGWRFGGIDALNVTVNRVQRITLVPPGPAVPSDVNLRDRVYLNLRTGSDLVRALTDVARRSGLPPWAGPATP